MSSKHIAVIESHGGDIKQIKLFPMPPGGYTRPNEVVDYATSLVCEYLRVPEAEVRVALIRDGHFEDGTYSVVIAPASERAADMAQREAIVKGRRDEIAAICERPDSYELIVRFTRSMGDDLGCGGDAIGNNVPLAEALRQQFVNELQQFYDDSGMAGHFQILSGPSLCLGFDNAPATYAGIETRKPIS